MGKLQKAVYGLKQLGFKSSKCDPSLFTFTGEGYHVIMLIYLDDIIITGDFLPLIQDLTAKLNDQFAFRGPRVFSWY